MRKLAVLALFTLAAAIPLHAQDRSQSYFTYDDGGTVVRQATDGSEIEGRVNLPLYPGDEVTTSRRGRTEIRLSDGNVVALDRATTVRFPSILNSYEGNAAETVAELRAGHVAAIRTPQALDFLRIDTQYASYIALEEASYAVFSDQGVDRVVVFGGTIEVRTPDRTARIREGEVATIDNRGINGVADANHVADEFEAWFIRRAERYGTASSRYLDRSLAYADDELAQNGDWNYVSSLGAWAWRPNVSVGWRPYFYGNWNYGPGGYLTWVSYEPWGWVPYHYGRWAYDPFYGWVWLPGGGYAPAWVYWMYGPDYVGWAPAGWYDCYKPYYNWCYRPYAHEGRGVGFGFYGRVSIHNVDLRPWTFVSPNHMVSTRIDRAALTTDAIRERLNRTTGGYTTVGNVPARFNRNELKDPNAAVNVISRRGLGGGTGKEGPGSSTDMTPFFRRDPDLSSNVRDHIVRGMRPADGVRGTRGGSGPEAVAPISGGGLAPIGSGSVAPIGGGSVAPIGGGSVAPSTGSGERIRRPNTGGGTGTTNPTNSGNTGSGTIDRGGRLGRGVDTPKPQTPSSNSGSTGSETWRDHINRPVTPPPPSTTTPRNETQTPPSRTPDRSHNEESWRNRAVGRTPVTPTPQPGTSTSSPAPATRGSDVPRRIIDRIGGARLVPETTTTSSGGSGSGSASAPRSYTPPRNYTPPPPRETPPPPRATDKSSPPPPKEHQAPPRNSSDGEKVHRDH